MCERLYGIMLYGGKLFGLINVCPFSVVYRQGQPFAETVDLEGHPLPHLHLSQQTSFLRFNLVLVRLCSFCHVAATFPFDSASGPAKM